MCLGAHDKRTEPDWFRQIASELIRVLLRRRVTPEMQTPQRVAPGRRAPHEPQRGFRAWPREMPALRGFPALTISDGANRGVRANSNISCGDGTISHSGCCHAADPPEERDSNQKGSTQNDQITVSPVDLHAPRSGGHRLAGLCSQSRSGRGGSAGQGRPTPSSDSRFALLNTGLAGLRRTLFAQPWAAVDDRGSSPCQHQPIAPLRSLNCWIGSFHDLCRATKPRRDQCCP